MVSSAISVTRNIISNVHTPLLARWLVLKQETSYLPLLLRGITQDYTICGIQINSMMAQRNGITMDDVNLLIDALQHMFENDMSSGRALTLRKLIVVEHTKPMGNVPRDTIENALTATLKIPDDCPTSYNDYIVTFHRNLLPKEVKVTEYGIDGSSKVML